MAMKFKYIAVSLDGKRISGTIEADDEVAVKQAIDSKGLIPIWVGRAAKGLEDLRLMTKRSIKHENLISFTRKLHTLSRAGVPLLQALDIIIEDTPDKRLGDALQDVRRHIEGGSGLAQALGMHEGYFPSLFIEAISAGEESGSLDVMLARSIELLVREEKTRGNIKEAVRYPVFVLITVALAFALIITIVIPKFSSLYSAYGAGLPWATRILIDINMLIKSYWPIFATAIPVLGFGLWRFRLTQVGKRGYDYTILSLPVISPLIIKTSMSRLCFTLSTLLAAGLPLSRTLSILRNSIGNYHLAKVIDKMGENLSGGRNLIQPARDSKYFSPLVVQMFSIGLESGSLENLLMDTAVHFDAEIDYDVKKLTSRIEPLLTVLIAGMVLIMALAIFTPMWNMIEVFKK